MKPEKAIERLLFTIQKGNKPNENDLNALTIIAEYIDNSRKQSIADNYLFAKMFVYNLWHEINHFRETKESGYKQSISNLKFYLDLSLESSIEQLRDRLNNLELAEYCEVNNLAFNHFKLKTKEEKEKLNDAFKNDENLNKLLIDGAWEKFELEENLVSVISDFINNYKDKK
jgi:hypothetical protein